MLRKIFAFGFCGLGLLAAAGQDAPANLVWKPAVGSVAKYKMTSSSNFQGQSADFGATLTIKVDSISGDKVMVTASTSEVSLKMGDQDLGAMMGDLTSTVKTTYTANGEVVERVVASGAAESDNPRLENAFVMTYPAKPLKAGDTWTRETKADEKLKLPASKATFTYVGREKFSDKFDTFKIKFDYAELSGATPMTATGTFWILASDGALMKTEYSMKNAEVGPGIIVDMTGKIVRVGYEAGK